MSTKEFTDVVAEAANLRESFRILNERYGTALLEIDELKKQAQDAAELAAVFAQNSALASEYVVEAAREAAEQGVLRASKAAALAAKVAAELAQNAAMAAAAYEKGSVERTAEAVALRAKKAAMVVGWAVETAKNLVERNVEIAAQEAAFTAEMEANRAKTAAVEAAQEVLSAIELDVQTTAGNIAKRNRKAT